MKALSQMFRQSLNMAERYGAIFMGISGAYPDQGLGKHFVLGHLSGYYNDLLGKPEGQYTVDYAGLPLHRTPGEEHVHFRIPILQKASGHWDHWLSSELRCAQHYTSFPHIVRWLWILKTTLHIAQLKRLELSYLKHTGRFTELREMFQGQIASRPNLLRALALKSYQKLQDPPDVVKL